jgi:hypothetical protein
MDFETRLQQAWAEHTTDAAAVAERLRGRALDWIGDEPQALALAPLAHHVFGEHLGRWQDGIAWHRAAAELPACAASDAVQRMLRRHVASLRLCADQADERAALALSDRVIVDVLAAGNLAERDTPRAADLLQQAASEARDLPATDPAVRALAAGANNLAAALERKPARSQAERALMIAAAQVAHAAWSRCGTWLHAERAEYRLAMTWLQAGDAARARDHALVCLALVAAQGDVALERFFGLEALVLAERAAGDRAASADALQSAHVAFAALSAEDQAACRATLDSL